MSDAPPKTAKLTDADVLDVEIPDEAYGLWTAIEDDFGRKRGFVTWEPNGLCDRLVAAGWRSRDNIERLLVHLKNAKIVDEETFNGPLHELVRQQFRGPHRRIYLRKLRQEYRPKTGTPDEPAPTDTPDEKLGKVQNDYVDEHRWLWLNGVRQGDSKMSRLKAAILDLLFSLPGVSMAQTDFRGRIEPFILSRFGHRKPLQKFGAVKTHISQLRQTYGEPLTSKIQTDAGLELCYYYDPGVA